MKLALSMIVRDAEKDIIACLSSVRDYVDQIVVVDTGSTDKTIALAKSLGAVVTSIQWPNNFAEARNAALDATEADWILSMDADERADDSAASMRKLIAESPAEGYLVSIRNYVLNATDRLWDIPAVPNDGRLPEASAYPAYVSHENVRLFRKLPHIRFSGRVHESVGPQIVAAGGTLGRTDFFLHHFGLGRSAEERERKSHLYREMGKQKILEMPDNAQAFLELGIVEFDNFHNYQEALTYIQRACALDPRLPTAWFFAGMASLKVGRPAEAIAYFKEAEKRGDRSPLLPEAKGDGFYNLQQYSNAASCYRRCLRLSAQNPDVESKLGLAEIREGNVSSGLKKQYRAIELAPNNSELHDRLILSLVYLDRLSEAADVAERRTLMENPNAAVFLRAASIRGHMGEIGRAASLVLDGLKLHPHSPALQQAALELGKSFQMNGNTPLPEQAVPAS